MQPLSLLDVPASCQMVITNAASIKTLMWLLHTLLLGISFCLLLPMVAKAANAAPLNFGFGKACQMSIVAVLQFGVVTQANVATLDSNFATVFQKVEQSVSSGGALQGGLFW